MTIVPLKTSVLRADKKQAEKVTEELLAGKTPNGKHPAKRVEIENGWQVTFPLKNENNERVESVIFEFTQTAAGAKIRYDERIVNVG
jgi:hypothetical protein